MGRNASKEHINKVMDESVASNVKPPTPDEAIKALKIDMQTAWIDADAFIADPYALLGQVIQIRKSKGGDCPASLSDPGFAAELTPIPVPCKLKESSKLSQPLLRKSIIVDQHLAASVSFLNYLSAEMTEDTSFSLMVFDQAAGLLDMTDAAWEKGLDDWKARNQALINDPEVCFLFAIAGFTQKNIVRKKYKKYSGKGRGGAFGVNINGELSTSTEDYLLDIKFGLTPIVLKRPDSHRVVRSAAKPTPASVITSRATSKSSAKSKAISSFKANSSEKKLFQTISGVRLIKRKSKGNVSFRLSR